MRATVRILVLIPLAFVAACIAAGGFFVLAAFGADTDTVGRVAQAAPGELIVLGLTAAAIVGDFSFVPALVAIVLAEAFGWRSLIFYLLAGSLIGLAAVSLLVAPDRAVSNIDARHFLAAGAVAGLAYWLIAGRTAGSWKANRI